MFTPSVEVDLGDAAYNLNLASPFAPIRFAQRAPGGDFWRAALSSDQLSRSDLRALLFTACDESAEYIDRLMLPENKELVLAALAESVENAIDALVDPARYEN